MAKVYAYLVKQKLWAIEQVPTKWRAEVQTILNN